MLNCRQSEGKIQLVPGPSLMPVTGTSSPFALTPNTIVLPLASVSILKRTNEPKVSLAKILAVALMIGLDFGRDNVQSPFSAVPKLLLILDILHLDP